MEVTSSWEKWDVVRTPIFPALLAGIDLTLGKGPLNFVVLNTAFLISGIFLVNGLLKKSEVNQRYRAIAVLAFMTPTVVTYQHTFLSEAGLSLVLLIIIWFALMHFSSPTRRYLILGIVLTCAYYYKPHFKYFAMMIFMLVYFAEDLHFSIKRPEKGWLVSLKAPVLGLLLFAFLIYPWDKALKNSGRLEVLNYFPIAMGVVPANKEYFGDYLGAYKKAIEEPSGIPRGGLSGDIVYPLLGAPNKQLLKISMVENPFGYLKAVGWTLSDYIWSPEVGSENSVFFQGMVGAPRTKIYYVPESMAELRDAVTNRFDVAYSPSILAKALVLLAPTLNFIVAIAILLLPIAFARAWYIKNAAAFIACGAALGYLGMHSLALMCIDRYAAPTIPLVFLAVVTAFFVPSTNEKIGKNKELHNVR